MDQSETDGQNREMPPEDNSSRHIPLPACVTSGFASVISIFFIGLAAGAVGGVLLGGTAVVVLQSLELLAEKKLLMDLLEIYITYNDYCTESINEAHDIFISWLAGMFGVVSSTLSLVIGIYIGLSTYAHVIKIKGEAAMGKALTVAGAVCLGGATATGYSLGLSLEFFLNISSTVSFTLWCVVPVVVGLCPTITEVWYKSHCDWDTIILWIFTPNAFILATQAYNFTPIRLALVCLLTPLLGVVKILETSHSLKLLKTATVPMMLVISDFFKIAKQEIVLLQPTTSTNTSSAVIEAIFVGVLTSQLLTVTVGMLLFVSWQRGGAAKICASAAASGGAALTAIKFGLPVLGPGPTIGALMGVAGAVGVSLSAAGEATDQYGKEKGHYGLVGRLGVTLGAAFGAFLSSCSHSGLSAVFMGMCAATIPTGAFVKGLFLPPTSWSMSVCLCMYLLIPALIISFTYSSFFCIMSVQFRAICTLYVFIMYVSFSKCFVF